MCAQKKVNVTIKAAIITGIFGIVAVIISIILPLSIQFVKTVISSSSISTSKSTSSSSSISSPQKNGKNNQNLIDVIKNNDVENVKNILIKGSDINSINNEYGATPLELAVARAQIDMIKLLLSYRADPNIRSLRGLSAFDVAIGKLDLSITKILINGGANINEKNSKGLTQIEQLAANKSEGPNYDILVVEIIEFLIDKGADISNDYYKAFFFATLAGNEKIVELFIDKGVDVNTRTAYGVTGLMSAASAGRASIVKYLLKKGANSKLVDNDKMTAYDYAIKSNDKETISILFKDQKEK